MNIRKAISSDAYDIAVVHIKSWQTTYKEIISDAYLSTLSIRKRECKWNERLYENKDFNFTYIAVDNSGKLVGFALGGLEQYDRENNGFMENSYKRELMAIYLLKEHQRKGIGRKLMSRIINHLVANGVNSMITWVLKKNLSSKFYESLDGILIGERIIKLGGESYVECAYGWNDLSIIP